LIQAMRSAIAAMALSAAAAEEVHVKYLGPVSLVGMDCRDHGGSLVWRTCFRATSSFAVVDLKGTYYGFCQLPAALMRDWRTASSMGRFFNQRIKGRFDC
jgi:hypothetical protein